MSYARFGADGSDVYVFYSCSDRYECSWCLLAGDVDDPDAAPWQLTAQGMIAHLHLHRSKGDVVPEATFAQLRAEVT